jgi:hypothetical protein
LNICHRSSEEKNPACAVEECGYAIFRCLFVCITRLFRRCFILSGFLFRFRVFSRQFRKMKGISPLKYKSSEMSLNQKQKERKKVSGMDYNEDGAIP